MKTSQKPPKLRREITLGFFCVILAGVAVLAGLFMGRRKIPESLSRQGASVESARDISNPGMTDGGRKVADEVNGLDEVADSRSHQQPRDFRQKSERPPDLLAALGGGENTARDRVVVLRGLRRKAFSNEERQRAIEFLTGQAWPESLIAVETHWVADELLTALRLQEPTWDGLAAELGKAAFQPNTDPVIRDYIIQHLGHLWEQNGAREEIEVALWRAVETADETTPGTALIALSRGYERDEHPQSLATVREQALELAQRSSAPLASRVTALAVAGEGESMPAKEYSAGLLKESTTPLILRKVAENVLAK